MLNINNYELLFLSVLIDGDNYGLGLSNEVKRITNDMVKVKKGSLYVILNRMEKKRLVTSCWEDGIRTHRGTRRRYYTISDKGINELKKVKEVFSHVWRMTEVERNFK